MYKTCVSAGGRGQLWGDEEHVSHTAREVALDMLGTHLHGHTCMLLISWHKVSHVHETPSCMPLCNT